MDILTEYNHLKSLLGWIAILNVALLVVGLTLLLMGEAVGLGLFVAGTVDLILAWLAEGYVRGLYLAARYFRDSVIAKGGEG